jgi:hypothetical protein
MSKPTLVAPTPANFSWRAALIGGALATGGNATLGTLLSNLATWFYMSAGLTVAQAYARMAAEPISLLSLMSLCVQVASGYCGGYVAVQYGRGDPLMQSAAAGLVGTTFFLAMLVSPASETGPIWSVIASLSIPIIASLWGGHAAAKGPMASGGNEET